MSEVETFQEAVYKVLEDIPQRAPADVGEVVYRLDGLIAEMRRSALELSWEAGWYNCMSYGLLGMLNLRGADSDDAAAYLGAAVQALDDVGRTVIAKQADYGQGNILAFGKFGVLVRLSDKIERIKNLTKTGRSPANESLLDSYRDICGYCTIGVLLERSWFTLPLAEDAS